MKRTNLSSVVSIAMSVALLSACGGSGDDAAGSPTAFSVFPTSVSFSAPVGTPAGVCLGGGTSEVAIIGGAAPYEVRNLVPAYVTVTPTQVGKNGTFTITTLGGCLKPGTILVVDQLNNVIEFTVNNEPAS